MVLVPLVCSMPIGLDDLNSSPAASRVHDGPVYGSVLEQVLQLLSFPHVVRYLGPMDIFLTSVVVYLLIYLIMFPFEKLEARRTLPR